MIDFKRHRFPAEIIITAVRWYLKYKLSLSDITELLLERGVNISRKTVREVWPSNSKIIRYKAQKNR